jgi:hypothetical protein
MHVPHLEEMPDGERTKRVMLVAALHAQEQQNDMGAITNCWSCCVMDATPQGVNIKVPERPSAQHRHPQLGSAQHVSKMTFPAGLPKFIYSLELHPCRHPPSLHSLLSLNPLKRTNLLLATSALLVVVSWRWTASSHRIQNS